MSPPPDATSPPDTTTQPPDPTSQPPKRYASQVRDEQARRTRRAIVTAAHDLFLAQGYAATTIDGIAEAAHVSRRTVFNSVGGKVALLKLALDWAIVGDDEPIALADRPAIKAILAESDPRKALMLWVQTVTDVAARTAPLGTIQLEDRLETAFEDLVLHAGVTLQRFKLHAFAKFGSPKEVFVAVRYSPQLFVRADILDVGFHQR